MPLTDHQELAAESRGGARLVSAAAGSGKTKVLVERLMRYVDRGADIDQFLVITYTRAAAAELRSRILSALGERIAADPMNRRLRRQTELCCRASIGTIDSICGRFLRENTHLAGISPDYRVIEPDRSDEICARVLDKLLEELYETIEEDAGVRALVDSFGSGDNDDKLSALVLRLYKSLQSHARRAARTAHRRVERRRRYAVGAVSSLPHALPGAVLGGADRGAPPPAGRAGSGREDQKGVHQ